MERSPVTALVVSVGDELLSGRVIPLNLSLTARWLHTKGVPVLREITVPDDVPSIRDTIRGALSPGRIVVVTGGLGPTEDDLTRRAAAEALKRPLEFQEDLLGKIRDRLKDWGIPEMEIHGNYARVPAGFRALSNPQGLAPGLFYEGPEGRLLLLPGVPGEVEAVLNSFPPDLLTFGGPQRRRVLLRTFGLRETWIAERIASNGSNLGPIHYLPGQNGVDIELEDSDRGGLDLDDRVKALSELLGDAVYGREGDTLASVVGEGLRLNGLRVAIAESCTGGLLAKLLTDVPGSSDYFMGGVVAYDNRVKTSGLGVDPGDLEKHGAVSEVVARAMAEGARERLGADVGISTTGIAGPTGGTEDKPVGLVHMGIAAPWGTSVRAEVFRGNRSEVRSRTASFLLNELRLEMRRR
jgi:nicotinamide-nucleotide amidase